MAQEAAGAEHAPYEALYSRIGRKGVQLNKPLDQLDLDELARMENFVHSDGDLYVRPGEHLLATAGASLVHSVTRMNDPQNAGFQRYWGMSTQLFAGTTGALSGIDAGYSGDPLTFCTARPKLSGEPWLVVADRTRDRKFSRTGTNLPLGLPVPVQPQAIAQAPPSQSIVTFQASAEQKFQGFPPDALQGVGANPVTITAVTAPSTVPGTELSLTVTNSQPNETRVTYLAGFAHNFGGSVNLSRFLVTGVDITDDDFIHLFMKIGNPKMIDEIRVYFVCAPFVAITPGPGNFSMPGAGFYNCSTAAYMLPIRPSDYTTALASTEPMTNAAEEVRRAGLLTDFANKVAAQLAQAPSLEGAASAAVWQEIPPPQGAPTGTRRLPAIRRGDCVKIGTAGLPGTDWSTITGIYVTIQTSVEPAGTFTMTYAIADLYFFGGGKLDNFEPNTALYDYRVTNYDPRTGAESNGSTPFPALDPGTIPTTALGYVEAYRQQVSVGVTPAADANLRQIAYRRGGTLPDDWRLVGMNTANGASIVDNVSDAGLAAAATVPTNHFQPVATVTAAGVTVLAQPVPVILGPLEDGTFLGLGDPYRPGHLYASLPGEIDHWPSTGAYAVEVCSPAEELMHGGVVSGQGLVLSRARGYAVHLNPDGGIVVQPTQITPGLATRWGGCMGPGGYFYVARDGIRVTGGEGSDLLSDPIRPLFQFDPSSSVPAVPTNGYYPIDWNADDRINLCVHNMDLWFTYQDTQGSIRQLVYSLVYRYWRPYCFAIAPTAMHSELTDGAFILVFGGGDGNGYTHEGYTDAGTPITAAWRTGAWLLGDDRGEKQLGDVLVDADLKGVQLQVQPWLNDETSTVGVFSVAGATGYRRYLTDAFGTTPQHARTLSVTGVLTAPTTSSPFVRRLGVSFLPEAPITVNRPTAWERPAGPTDGYIYACSIDCDTAGLPIIVQVEADLAGAVTTIASLTVNSSGRHKQWFSWPAAHANAIRLRPTGDCTAWTLWSLVPIATPEPPRIAGWDTNWEQDGTGGDRYYTGVDLEVDTLGQDKLLQFQVDQQTVSTQTVNAAGRRWVHITITPGRGHLFRIVATDTNPGYFYSHRWLTTPEPGEQTNWNAGFTTWSSLSDKYLKGLVIEADTFGQPKSVDIEVDDQGVRYTFAVNHSQRLVKTYTFPQILGRVFRVIPSDSFASRPYTILPIFDEEPYALARWETQELDFDLPGAGWGQVLSADICYRSSVDAVWGLLVYQAHTGAAVQTLVHTLPSTGGVKRKVFVPAAAANKGVLYKSIFQTADLSPTLTLYKEESRIRVAPWGRPELAVTRLIAGNDDKDRTREMTSSVAAAARSGGGTG